MKNDFGLIEPIVRLRLAIPRARDSALVNELRATETLLRRALGPRVPKRVAARVLGTSVTALDRWLDRGYLPLVATSRDAGRLAVETTPLLDLAVKARQLRASGRSRGVLAQALRELGWRDRGRRVVIGVDLAALPRPNVSADALAGDFKMTTPHERICQLFALNRTLAAAVRGRVRG